MLSILDNQRGAIPILVIVGIIGILGVMAMANLAPFKNNFLASLYPKDQSFAAVSGPISPSGVPTPSGVPSVGITVSPVDVKVTLNRFNTNNGIVLGQGIKITAGPNISADTWVIESNKAADQFGFWTSASGISPNQTQDNQLFINTSKPDGVYSGTAKINFYKNGQLVLTGPTLSYTITLNSDSLDRGLVSWWKMNETLGQTVADEKGLNNGVATGTTVSGGKNGNARFFYGNGKDKVDLGTSTSLNPTTAISLSAWYYPWSVNNRIIAERRTVSNDGGWIFYLDGNGKPSLYLNAGGWKNCSINLNAVSNTWNLFTATYDGTNVKLYNQNSQNGMSVATCSVSGAISAPVANTHIGYDVIASTTTSFNGVIDDFRIWNRALTLQEVYSLTGTPTPSPSSTPSPSTLYNQLISYWRMDESSNQTLSDITNTNNGAVSTSTVTSGKIGNGRSIISNSDKINVGTSTTLNPSIAVSSNGWIKGNNLVASVGIIDRRATNNMGGWILFANANKASMYIYTSNWNLCSGTTTLSNNTWYMITGVYDGSKVNLYVNGVLDKTCPLTGAMNVPNPANTYIGGNYTTTSGFLNGVIDELGVWSRALNSSEVTQLYNAGAGKQL